MTKAIFYGKLDLRRKFYEIIKSAPEGHQRLAAQGV